MATRPLYIDFSNMRTWTAEDNEDSAISGAYEQRQNNQPKVQWALNAVPFSTGVKSLTPRTPPEVVESPNFESIFAPSTSELSHLLDVNGDSIYTYLDSLGSENLFTPPIMWMWGTTVAGQWSKLLTANSVTSFLKRSTVFQTQTLQVLNFGDTFGAGVTESGDSRSTSQVFSYDATTNTAEVYRLTGVNFAATSFLGLTSYQNYLMLWTETTIYWSSPTDFQDFAPAIGGGGSTRISEAKGNIKYIVPNTQGLVVYCEYNIIQVAFSGDSSNPWIFNEIAGSSGVLSYENHRILVTSDETAQLQVALTTQGLMAVAPNAVQPLDPIINESLINLSMEYKDLGSVDIKSTTPPDTSQIPETSIIRNIQLLGSKLFIMKDIKGFAQESDLPYNSVTIVYDMITSQVTQIQGTCLTLANTVTSTKSLLPNNYLAIFRLNAIVTYPLELNFAQGTDRESTGTLLRDAEVIVGNLQVSRSKTTIIHSVRLDGRLHSDSTDSDRCKVFLYSKSVLGATNPVEFNYVPEADKYYGYIEGKDLQMEVRGKNFYLTGAEVEVEVGGEF